MYPTVKKLTTLVIIMGLAALLSACNAESSSSTSGGGSSSGGSPATGTLGSFNLVFSQTRQDCRDCNVWFDSARLEITHSSGNYTFEQTGGMRIHRRAKLKGRFFADLSAIPDNGTISNATLYMTLNRDEGIANADFTSVVEVYGTINGKLTYVRDITARSDIKGKGYSKLNPVVPIDFTSYAQQL